MKLEKIPISGREASTLGRISFRGGKNMLHGKVDNWPRMVFALLVFWAVLCFSHLIFSDIAAINPALTAASVQQGYFATLRGLLLLLSLLAVGSIIALLRRGLLIAPLVWVAQILRLAWFEPGLDMVRNILFVSDALNLAVLALAPVLISILLWQGLERLDPHKELGFMIFPGFWLTLVILSSAGSLFVWHWSQQLGLGLWTTKYGLVLLPGLAILANWAGRRPWLSLVLLFSGWLLPGGLYVVFWGWHHGLALFLMTLLPWTGDSMLGTWVALMSITALPVLASLGMNQFIRWRKGKKLLQLI